MLILGGSGFVGSTLIDYAKKDYDISVTTNTNKVHFDNIPDIHIDFLKTPEKINELIKNINPDIVINTVGHPSVDLCESDHQIANYLHVDIPTKISNICKDVDAKLIQFSTDAVFNSNSIKKFTENEKPDPINYYGASRLAAEKIILEKSRKNVVLRTAVVFGWNKKSRFTDWIINSLQHDKLVDPHNDQYNTPTLVDDLCQSILEIIKQNTCGLFHATGKTCISRAEFAMALADGFSLNKDLIKPVTSEKKKQIAPRSYCSCLNSSKLENEIKFNFSNVESAISFIYYKSKNPSHNAKLI
jgi:dTDP-4-dehydrorhamnose reductase